MTKTDVPTKQYLRQRCH